MGPFKQAFYTNNAHRDYNYIFLERILKSRQIQKIETTWWHPLITNVKVVSRYIALGHDTYREPPYRYCINIYRHIVSPLVTQHCLEKSFKKFKKWKIQKLQKIVHSECLLRFGVLRVFVLFCKNAKWSFNFATDTLSRIR